MKKRVAADRPRHIEIADGVKLEGLLAVPDGSRSIVLFAHGSGSSRLSPRNTFVADVLNNARISTLLFDLLTEEEDEVYRTRFDIGLLTRRLVAATRWVMGRDGVKRLPIGYFGASTGAAAALMAAAELGTLVRAVVSRGGRPDLAEDGLGRVLAPTLLIVGGDDRDVIELNRIAYDQLTCVKELAIVPGASHLFEEPGTLEEVARLAADWFSRYLTVKGAVLR